MDPDALIVEREVQGDGHRHVLYRQTYRGLPVEFTRVKVHMNDDGSVIGLNSSYEPGLTLDVVPAVAAEDAKRAAEADSRGQASGAAELVVLPLVTTGRTPGNQCALRRPPGVDALTAILSATTIVLPPAAPQR